MNLLEIAESRTFTPEQIATRTAQIHTTLLKRSAYLREPNFTRIHTSDLKLLFAEYDERFFDRQIQQALGSTPLTFGFSNRMTSAGGRTSSTINRATGSRRYEIHLSTTLLYGCFSDDDHRAITVCGMVCTDRLQAVQRIMEHELVHLVEMLVWNQSQCSQQRFQEIALRLFGHTDFRHRLILAREKVIAQYGIRPGMTVRFRFDGVEHTGLVNRINKRATVLVEDPAGVPYRNGKHYQKYYIPAEYLETVEDTESSPGS